MNTSRRTVLIGSLAWLPLAASGASLAAAPAPDQPFTPEAFGAKGDGRTNDSLAFARLAAAVNANGGGVVSLGAGKTYIVGLQGPQVAAGQYFLAFHDILAFERCTRPVTLRGNGARLKCEPGLLYGTFDRLGRPTRHPMPWTGPGELATPYRYMIRFDGCTGPIEVSDLELDGNVSALRLGGPYGDTGMQIPAVGLALFQNHGSETIRNVHTHHHGQDGVVIVGITSAAAPGTSRRMSGVRSEYNGRQGCSIVSGRGYVFENCQFNHTGRAGIYSAPGAGVDIEAETGPNRDFRFVNCEFVDNAGCGMVADSGDSEGASFESCRFVGTTAWSAWPNKPRFRFSDCTFVGPIVKCFADPDPQRATQFHSCRFTDDPRLSPTGKVFASGGANAIADLGSGSKNVLFDRCVFQLVGKLVLPWSWEAIYSNCRMSQTSQQLGYPKGTYLGRNSLVGKVDLYGAKIVGSLTVNGRPFGR